MSTISNTNMQIPQLILQKDQTWIKENSNVPRFMLSLGKLSKENLINSTKLKKDQYKIKKNRMNIYKSLLKEVKKCELEARNVKKAAKKARKDCKEMLKII